MVEKRTGFHHVCTLPEELGSVTKLEIKNGRVIARTESGLTFIVPSLEGKDPDDPANS